MQQEQQADNRQVDLKNPDGSSTGITVFPADRYRPVILIVPALGMRAAYYEPMAAALQEAGYAAVTCDLRGKGLSSVRPSRESDFGYKEMLDQDLHTVVCAVNKEFPGRPVYLMGHSLGGQLGLLYASKHPDAIDGFILVASCSVYYKGWEGLHGFRILISTQMVGLISRIMGYFPGKRVGFGGTNAETMMMDWSRQSRTGRYEPAGDGFDYESALTRLNVPVLAINFEGDNFAPLRALEILTEKLDPRSAVEKVFLRREDPLNLGYNHFNWPKKPESIVRLIAEWLGIPDAENPSP